MTPFYNPFSWVSLAQLADFPSFHGYRIPLFQASTLRVFLPKFSMGIFVDAADHTLRTKTHKYIHLFDRLGRSAAVTEQSTGDGPFE
jgi:hypothetical protein